MAGGIVSGISSYREGNRGKALIGDFIGGALIGGALGAASTIGGLFGASMIGLKTTAIALGLSTIVSFGAGVGAYSFEHTWGRDLEWSTNDALLSGSVVALESIINFTIGASFSASGLWSSLNQGELGKMYDILRFVGFGKILSGLLSPVVVLSLNSVQIILRSAIKLLFTYPWSFLRRNLNEYYENENM